MPPDNIRGCPQAFGNLQDCQVGIIEQVFEFLFAQRIPGLLAQFAFTPVGGDAEQLQSAVDGPVGTAKVLGNGIDGHPLVFVQLDEFLVRNL